MTSSDSNPKLPLWIFLVTDAVLVTAAFLIRTEAKHPLSNEAIFAIVGCLVAGAIVALVPIIAHYERAKNEALDERQRALESLARTLTAAAEQISIAASGFHEIADISQKNLRQAEQLPHKLQEKVAEFQAQLKDANDTEKEELEKEVAELRASESDKLEATASKVAKAVAEFTKLEAATQQHLNAANEALNKLSFGAAGAIGKAQAAAEQAFAQARTEAARGLGEAAGNAAQAIESAKASALAEIDAKLIAVGTALVEKLAREATRAAPALTVTAPAPAAPAPTAEPPAPEPESPAPVAADPAQPPKRPRKRREEPVAPEAVASSEAPAVAVEEASPKVPPAEEPAPIPAAQISEVAPIAPHTSEPFHSEPTAAAAAVTVTAPVATAPEPEPVAVAAVATEAPGATAEAEAPVEPPKALRKRAPKKVEVAPEPEPEAKAELKLELDDTPARPSAEVAERVLSSDGATRLLVTAYIGIGNRLFIRGAGPGLTWEKGIPLQFVSIGKWRWETNDASGPVEFKLYKNDDIECAALGAQKLDPGYQQEVTAAF